LQLLLLDSNETGGLIVMNVIWSHFLFGTPQKTASVNNRRCMWQKVGGVQKPESLEFEKWGDSSLSASQKFTPMSIISCIQMHVNDTHYTLIVYRLFSYSFVYCASRDRHVIKHRTKG